LSVFAAWDKAKPLLEEALVETKGTHTIDDVCLMVGAGHFKLWCGEKSAAVTEFIQMPRMKILSVFICGGELEELRKMETEKLIPFAKENGCTRIIGAGRAGWSRVPSDWTRGGVYMHKDI
jgi:hypothetical protein